MRIGRGKLHCGYLLTLRDNDFMSEPNKPLIGSVSHHCQCHVNRPLMVRHHLRDEVAVHVPASAGLHVSHHDRHSRRAALKVLSFSLRRIDRFGFEGACNGPGKRMVTTP
jgi:hypothetical protein